MVNARLKYRVFETTRTFFEQQKAPSTSTMSADKDSSKDMANTPANDNSVQSMAVTTTTVFHSNTSIAAMPQNQPHMVQVPAEILSALLTSINGLRQEVTSLHTETKTLRDDLPDFIKARQEIALLRSQVRSDMKSNTTSINNQLRYLNRNVRDLERRCGIAKGFTCFNQLPPELRIKVWRFALFQPELFAVEKKLREIGHHPEIYDNAGYFGKWSTAKSQIMWVNQEARKEAKKVLTEFDTNTFLNYWVDTVWLVRLDWLDEPYYDLAGYRLQGSARSLAIHYTFFIDDLHGEKEISQYDNLSELVLIVGKEDGLSGTKPVMVEPRNAPSRYTKDFSQLEGESWSAMGEKVVKEIQGVAKQRIAYRKHLMEGMLWLVGLISPLTRLQDHDISEDELDDDPETWALWDTIPAVRFVELVSEHRFQQIKDAGAGEDCSA